MTITPINYLHSVQNALGTINYDQDELDLLSLALTDLLYRNEWIKTERPRA